MPRINQFIWDGNLTASPTIGYLRDHTAVTEYTVAQSRVWMEGDQRREETDYLRIKSYGRQAEADSVHLTKGFKVTVMGHMRPWVADSGKSGVDFIADIVIYQNDVLQRRLDAMLADPTSPAEQAPNQRTPL